MASLVRNEPDLSGIWHVASAPITKYELLKLVNRHYYLGVELACDEKFAIDRRLDADLAARGVDAWVDRFDRDGAARRDHLAIGQDAIRSAAASMFVATAGARLERAPIASGLSPAGDLGYTVGRSRERAAGADRDSGSDSGSGDEERPGQRGYVTVWRRQADGGWRALFDLTLASSRLVGQTR